ncbi:MAG: hypothetical protein AABZ39_12420 [Spirochaetota bacterium]
MKRRDFITDLYKSLAPDLVARMIERHESTKSPQTAMIRTIVV